MEHAKNNARRLVSLLECFEIPAVEVAHAVGYSKAYLTRVMKQDIEGSDSFFKTIEDNLGRLIEKRKCRLFQYQGVAMGKLEMLKEPSSSPDNE